MIKKINNFTHKSFKDYTNPNDLEFKQKNIIFGYNGKGKSSLSLGVKEEFFKGATKTEDNLRFYNKDDYIKNVLLLENENSKLRGVKASFGEKAVSVENKLKELNSQIVNTESTSKEIENKEADIRKEISTIHNNKRGTAKIQQKDKSITIYKILQLYNNDLIAAKDIEANEDKLKEIKGDNKLEDKKQQIEALDVGYIDNISEVEVENIKNIFSETFQDIEIPSSEIIDWLNQGLRIHEKGDNCKFCGGKLDYGNLKYKVKEYNDNKKRQAALKLQDFSKQLQKLETQIGYILDKKESVLSILNPDDKLEDLYKTILNNKNEIVNVENSVVFKLEHINQSIFFDDSVLKNTLKGIMNVFSQIKTIRDEQKRNIEIQVGKKDILVKGSIAYEILNNKNIEHWKSEIATKQKILTEERNNNKEINDKIEKLKDAKSEYKDFAEYLNKILSDLSIDLKLELIDKDYILKHSINNDLLTIDEISEGEKNLLALLFFYYELFEDNEQQKLKNLDLIIIDDPASSLDHLNKMYILEMMKHLLDISNSQIFIMTHSWEDFCDLRYGKKDKDDILFVEVKKNKNSFLKLLKKVESPYRHHFREIFELSEKHNTDDLTDCEIYHYPNIIRSVLEEFLRFKATNSNPTRKNEQIIGKVLFNKEWNSIPNEEKLKLETLLSVCNILSHNLSKNADDILRSAKFLMTKIKEVDKNHFDTNKENYD
jgi:wobble nucleotide-excising tRNase